MASGSEGDGEAALRQAPHDARAAPFLDGSARSPKTRWELPQTCIHQNARRSEPHAAAWGVKRALQARARKGAETPRCPPAVRP